MAKKKIKKAPKKLPAKNSTKKLAEKPDNSSEWPSNEWKDWNTM